MTVHVDADTVNDATAFLETFFKLYPTAMDKELVNPVFTIDGDNVKVNVAVKFIDNQIKATQVSQ